MELKQANECLAKMLDTFRSNMGAVTFSTWFEKLKVYFCDNHTLILITDNPVTAKYLNTRYLSTIDSNVPIYFGIPFDEVKILTEADAERLVREKSRTKLNPKYTFETFIVGQGNNVAHAASLAVAECPGEIYNPLFIYGGSGLGKTHLMTAIANYVLGVSPSTNIEFSNAEKFTNEVVEAIRSKRTQELRNRMRNVDMLFIDDVQFLTNRTATQEEFFNTFNELYNSGKQIVISSDRPPDEIPTLEERMRSRFKSGIVAAIDRPDFETRLAILSSKAENEGIAVEEEALYLLAQNIDSNIRELEGSLTNAKLLAKVHGNSVITAEIAAAAIKDHKPSSPQEKEQLSVETIIEEVAARFRVSGDDILSSNRSKEFTVPRQMAIYLARELLGASTTRIGADFKRDHTPVMHACKKAEELMEEDSNFSSAVQDIRMKLGGR